MSNNVILLADGGPRGRWAFAHAMWTWEDYIYPPEEHSFDGFGACMAAAKQGPDYHLYDDAIDDICKWCTLEHEGMIYHITMVDGDVWGYIPDTPEAVELLA